MAKKVGLFIERPGRNHGDEAITISVPEALMTEPGIPKRDRDVAFFSREDPIENMALSESASAEWSREERILHSPEATEFFDQHERNMEPIVEGVRHSGDLEPTGTPSGVDVTEAIRLKAR